MRMMHARPAGVRQHALGRNVVQTAAVVTVPLVAAGTRHATLPPANACAPRTARVRNAVLMDVVEPALLVAAGTRPVIMVYVLH